VILKRSKSEMGVEIAGFNFNLLTTRSVIRRDLKVDGHLTALLTTNAAGEQALSLLIFPRKDTTAIPANLFGKKEVRGRASRKMLSWARRSLAP